MYDIGVYNKTKKIIQKYIKEHAEDLTPFEEENCNDFLKIKDKVLDENIRIVLTTHTRVSTFDESVFSNAITIIDEDILVSSFFLQTRSISLGTLYDFREKCTGRAKKFIDSILDNNDGEVHFISDYGNYNDCKLSYDELQEMDISDNINDLFSAATYLIDKDKETLYYYAPGKLSPNKCIVLSATLDEDVYKKYFNLSDYEVLYIEGKPVKYKGKLYQFTASTVGRATLDKEGTFEKVQNAAKRYVDENTPIITFMKYQYYNFAKNKQSRVNIAPGLYFSKCLGSNKLKNKDIIVLGTPFMNDISYKLIGYFLDDNISDFGEVHRRIQYKEYEFYHRTYEDSTLRNLQCYWMKGELEQAVGRARIIQYDKTVVVFSTVPCEQATFIGNNYLIDNETTEKDEDNLDQ